MSVFGWLWYWTGHQVAHLLGLHRGAVERRIVRSGRHRIAALGFRCRTCGQWDDV